MKYLSHILFASSLIVSLCIGGVLGIEYQRQSTPFPLEKYQCGEKNTIPVVSIHHILGDNLELQASHGGIRVYSKNHIYSLPENTVVSIPVKKMPSTVQKSASKTKEELSMITNNTPQGALFFASSRGKRYYPISNTSQLQKMSPKNLIFFTSEEDAQKKGLTLSQ